VDLTLNSLNRSLGFLTSFLLEFFKLLLVLRLDLQFHLGQLDLVFVLGLGDLLLEHRAVVLPLSQLKLIQKRLFRDVRIRLIFFFDFLDGDLATFEFLVGLLPEVADIRLHFFHSLVRQFLIFLLEVEHFIPEHQQLLHFVCVRHS